MTGVVQHTAQPGTLTLVPWHRCTHSLYRAVIGVLVLLQAARSQAARMGGGGTRECCCCEYLPPCCYLQHKAGP